ncbi:hypothetical protein NPIL_588261 [Nephila pilipes]|uniref:Uncharacterized protein n=1 Tax=Nephila pilipes TaxID=299642 RepID=A0A8X6QC81_NEPPI|nr:hypothetical protein NPIL_588261 [Nephila pilipes]
MPSDNDRMWGVKGSSWDKRDEGSHPSPIDSGQVTRIEQKSVNGFHCLNHVPPPITVDHDLGVDRRLLLSKIPVAVIAFDTSLIARRGWVDSFIFSDGSGVSL